MKMRVCACGYTLRETCPACGKKTKSAHPPKFSTADKYGKYRRQAKRLQKN